MMSLSVLYVGCNAKCIVQWKRRRRKRRLSLEQQKQKQLQGCFPSSSYTLSTGIIAIRDDIAISIVHVGCDE